MGEEISSVSSDNSEGSLETISKEDVQSLTDEQLNNLTKGADDEQVPDDDGVGDEDKESSTESDETEEKQEDSSVDKKDSEDDSESISLTDKLAELEKTIAGLKKSNKDRDGWIGKRDNDIGTLRKQITLYEDKIKGLEGSLDEAYDLNRSDQRRIEDEIRGFETAKSNDLSQLANYENESTVLNNVPEFESIKEEVYNQFILENPGKDLSGLKDKFLNDPYSDDASFLVPLANRTKRRIEKEEFQRQIDDLKSPGKKGSVNRSKKAKNLSSATSTNGGTTGSSLENVGKLDIQSMSDSQLNEFIKKSKNSRR